MENKNQVQTQQSKYRTLSEWRNSDRNAYRAALRRGLIDEICQTFGWKKYKRSKNIKHG